MVDKWGYADTVRVSSLSDRDKTYSRYEYSDGNGAGWHVASGILKQSLTAQ
jgi:hypothetical protein